MPRVFWGLVALLAAVGLVFAIWPGLDLAVSHAFYDNGGFAGSGAGGQVLRWFFRVAPFVVVGVYALAYARRRWSGRLELWIRNQWVGRGPNAARIGNRIVAGLRRLAVLFPWAPPGKQVLFLAATLAIGPGLIVNLGMKDHLHRPRPVHVKEFGGNLDFRPWYRFDGGCSKNCSFSSGEASAGFWMTAPALLTPPPFRPLAIAGALAFGALASILRLAFGGHFLSDVLFAGIISLMVIFALRRAIWPRGAP